MASLLRIGLDFDGVITDCGELKVAAARSLYGVDIPAERFKRELVIRDGVLTGDQYNRVLDLIFDEPVAMTMPAIPYALDTVRQLQAEGHALRIVTSRGGKALMLARSWLTHQGISIEIVGTDGMSKRELTQGLDVFLDDDLDKLVELAHVPHRYLMSHPYNTHVLPPEDITRIHGWTNFKKHVGALAT